MFKKKKVSYEEKTKNKLTQFTFPSAKLIISDLNRDSVSILLNYDGFGTSAIINKQNIDEIISILNRIKKII